MTLVDYPPAMRPGLYRDLTKLHFLTSGHGHAARDDIGVNIIQVLRDCPNMAELRLEVEELQAPQSDLSEQLTPVRMLRLQRIILHLPDHLLIYIMHRLIVPCTCAARIGAWDFRNFSGALRDLPSQLPPVGCLEEAILRVQSDPSVTGTEARLFYLEGHTIHGQPVTFALSAPFSSNSFPTTIADSILRAYAMSALRRLELWGELGGFGMRLESEDMDALIKCLRHLSALQILTLRSMSDSFRKLWDIFARHCRSRDSPVFPELREIRFRSCVVSSSLMKFLKAWPSLRNLQRLEFAACTKERIMYGGDVIAQVAEYLSWSSPGTEVVVSNEYESCSSQITRASRVRQRGACDSLAPPGISCSSIHVFDRGGNARGGRGGSYSGFGPFPPPFWVFAKCSI
ncbi:hypothetical protein OE88DRAFT_1066085 [Heliocybe sulcata]|uniref:Uncharacterized protein n=1 Tax=Heliocybe sulcata TaxID=5364 RepID=A0A5C3MKT5_9AGAM|nr:hypothetical protein OE88DRAFT_1066085 [Heliocybe sulcata]